MLPIAVDAMGGDHAPGEIVAGARRPPPTGIPVVLVGPADLADACRHRRPPADRGERGHRRWTRTPPRRVRRKKDSTLVARRRGRPRRQGLGDDLGRQHRRHDGVGAAADGPHQGRQPPGDRHADPGARRRRRRSCSTPAPTPRCRPSGSCSSPRWARCTPATASASAAPKVGLLSIGEEAGKGDSLRKEAFPLLAGGAPGIDFIGNVEGRDIMTDDVDVIVTDGFTGNVVLKTLEGGVHVGRQGAARGDRRRRTYREHADALMPALAPLVHDARPGHLRRCGAARRRRRVHHLPRLDRRRRPCSTASGSPTRWSQGGIVDELRERCAVRRHPTRSSVARRCLPRPTSNRARSGATRSSRSSATAWPTSSRSSPGRSARASRSSTTSMPTRSP